MSNDECQHERVEAPDHYETDCGEFYWSNAEDQQRQFEYCPYCGKRAVYELV